MKLKSFTSIQSQTKTLKINNINGLTKNKKYEFISLLYCNKNRLTTNSRDEGDHQLKEY